MKHAKSLRPARRLILELEQLRLIAGGDSEAEAGPQPTHGSTASGCQTTKFACC